MRDSVEIAVLMLALVSAWFDARTRMIPNGVTLGGICCGFLLACLGGTIFRSLGGILSACLLIWPYCRGWVGGGDVKLMMAYGTLLGAWPLLDLWVGAALLSLLIALGSVLICRQPFRKIGIPYAIPLALAAFLLIVKRWMS